MPDDHVSGNTLGGVVPKDIEEEVVVENGTEERRDSLRLEGH